MKEVLIGRSYRHFKGDIIKVLYIGLDSETLDKVVIYEHNNEIWVRPYDMFMEKVDKEKYPEIGQEYRFELQDVKSVKE